MTHEFGYDGSRPLPSRVMIPQWPFHLGPGAKGASNTAQMLGDTRPPTTHPDMTSDPVASANKGRSFLGPGVRVDKFSGDLFRYAIYVGGLWYFAIQSLPLRGAVAMAAGNLVGDVLQPYASKQYMAKRGIVSAALVGVMLMYQTGPFIRLAIAPVSVMIARSLPY